MTFCSRAHLSYSFPSRPLFSVRPLPDRQRCLDEAVFMGVWLNPVPTASRHKLLILLSFFHSSFSSIWLLFFLVIAQLYFSLSPRTLSLNSPFFLSFFPCFSLSESNSVCVYTHVHMCMCVCPLSSITVVKVQNVTTSSSVDFSQDDTSCRLCRMFLPFL